MRLCRSNLAGKEGGPSAYYAKFKDDYAQIADDRPRGPKTKLRVVELAGRPNERRLYAQVPAVVGAAEFARDKRRV